MSSIRNIGFLDVRHISEELAQKITTIENIGIFIESEESQILLKDCKKMNIGASIKIPKNKDFKLVTQNGHMQIDSDFLTGIMTPIIIALNGSLFIDNNIDIKLLDEKLHYILVNGELICAKKHAGLIQSKGMVNGNIIKYSNDYKYYDEVVNLTNRFLKSMKPNSKLAFNTLIIVEDIDMKIFEEKISSIEVLNKLILFEKYEDSVSEYIDDYYQVDKVLIPSKIKNAKYIDDNIIIDDNSIKEYDHIALYIDGNVEINLKDDVAFSEHIEYLICDKVICNEKNYEIVKNSLASDVNVELIEGKILKNRGKMTLSEDFKETITIKNLGKLIIDKSINIDNFNEKVAAIINYGIIEAPEDILSIVKNKLKENYDGIGILRENDNKNVKDNEDVLYENMADLKL